MNETFSNLKLIMSIITVFTCCNKDMKQVVLINHSWDFPKFTKWMGIRVLFILSENGGFPKKGEIHKKVEVCC